MTLNELIAICKSWSALGNAITEQIESTVDRDLNDDTYNPNAAHYIERFLMEAEAFVDEDVWDLMEYLASQS